MKSFPVYGFCSLVTASLVVLLAMSTDFFVAYINNIITPCQHDSEYRNGQCICDNTRGVFVGKYCEDCQCKHLGLCSVMENSTSRWGCRCPSHQKWTSILCDKCYAKDHTSEHCRGDCLSVEGVYEHFGPKCETVCMPAASSSAGRCLQVRSGGGTCNACNGHGQCTSSGQCKCDPGYFTSRAGEQCSLQCSSAGIDCPYGQGTCQSVGGQLQCVCERGWYGSDCSQSCLQPSGNGMPCSGHGTCGYDEQNTLECSCSTHWIGDFCEQRCPGDASYPESCSSHGTCLSKGGSAVCECDSGWHGQDCSCSPQYTCSGHGTCADDATCECFDYTRGNTHVHFDGAYCEQCKENWFGSACHLYCESSKKYDSNADTNGVSIGCNGHGACQLDTPLNHEYVTCVCDGTNPDTFCATCLPDYYPSWSNLDVSVAHCSVPCEPGTCSNRGICNPDYNGYNDVCICETYKMPGTNIELDTLDAKQNCQTCKPNWYPTSMSRPDRCTKYCAAEGMLENNSIVFVESATERNYDLMGDLDAQKICTASGTFFAPDADCSVCSSQGSCYADGTCKCNEGTTGEHCNIQCTSPDGLQCSDHGRCVRNELELWFNPNSRNFRCECLPYDPYTSETRQRLVKQNFRVAPPPAPHYHGQFCEFHCPRYNDDICADRGECSTGIAVDNQGYTRSCTDDADCGDINGAFCARQSSPWDSLMENGKSFFSSGPDSPGYYTCSTSAQCMDDIYSMRWDEFCVNMLHGWYPPVLNTAECTYSTDNTCREAVETFFMSEFANGSTWCESALEKLLPRWQGESVCGPKSHADDQVFQNERIPVCLEYTLETTCNSQIMCTYDQTMAHIQSVDKECTDMQPPCTGPCQATGAQTCETKTYCRAKNCPDALFENSIESLCIVEPPCDSDKNWADFCADASGRIRNQSDMTTMDTFYSCHMLRNRVHPNHMEAAIPGGIRLNGMLRIFGEDVSVESLRASVIASRVSTGPECAQENFAESSFCDAHLSQVAPDWYTPIVPSTDWFMSWLVVCPEGPDSLWSTEARANGRLQSLSGACRAEHRSAGVDGDWTAATDEKDSISYSTTDTWSLTCPGQTTKHFEDPRIVHPGRIGGALACLTSQGWTTCDTGLVVEASSFWPQNPSGCLLKGSTLLQRWGERGWSPADVQREFTQSCQEGLGAPWIPKPTDLPTICDLGACHFNDECLLCSDPDASCDKTASVQCKSPVGFHFRDENRCGHDGNIWQPFAIPQRNYFCDWVPPENVTVVSDTGTFDGRLNARGILTIFHAASSISVSSLTVNGVTKNISSLRTTGDDVSLVWSDTLDVPAAVSESHLETLQQCNADFNWYSYCADKPYGTTLDTTAAFGLKQQWSGTSNLVRPHDLVIESLTYQGTTLHNVSVVADDRVLLKCGTDSVEGVGHLHLNGTFDTCRLLAVYQRATVHSIIIDDVEQVLDFDSALEGHATRTFFRVEANKNKTDYSDWTFEDNGVLRKRAFDYDNSGVRFDFQQQHDALRVSGWTYVQDDEGQLASMRLTNDNGAEILQIYVWAHALYVKRGALAEHHGERIASVPSNKWWYWSIQAEHVQEQRFQAENHTTFAPNQTYFVQEWNVTVRVDAPEPIVWNGRRQMESVARLQHHHRRVAPAFHSLTSTRHECEHVCLHHSQCRQFSHSADDSLCYLHSAHCEDDTLCVHGKHTLTSVHSHKASHFEIFADAPKTSLVGGTKWRHLRAEPIIEAPACQPVRVDDIHERWRAAFVRHMVPFEPDATSVCNAITDSWRLMPKYVAKTCYGEPCPHDEHDLSACGNHLSTLYPDVPTGCPAVKYLETNWTAYCRYMSSFDPITTDTTNRVPFLGGRPVNMEDMCTGSWKVFDDARDTCASVESLWFKECFERTSVYEEHCSNECLEDIEDRLSTTNVSKGICHIREDFLNVHVAPDPCHCPLGDLIVTDFCLMQDTYHEGNTVTVPELFHSECFEMPACADTLKNSLNRSEWLSWCSDLSRGAVAGACSKTTCKCDESNVGVAGTRCELSCPSGISDGQELACSGPNGRCFAVDPTEIIPNAAAQRAQGETRERANVSGPLVPTWLNGPTPSMEGRCQCALGSGTACSIPCDRCNNGTYGVDMASQHGICDSFNGICRSLPSFMRYNTKTNEKISYNTTAFGSALGVYRWQHPERFLYESDNTIFEQALRNQYDSTGERHYRAGPMPSTLLIDENVNTMLRVFKDLCWSQSDDFLYLDNSKGVQLQGVSLSTQQPSRDLKETPVPSWGQCTKIPVTDTFYFCFARGEIFAFDNGPLLVRSSGAYALPKQKMTFVKQSADTLYAYGGEYPYEKTSQVFDELYKITFERRPWFPRDIVFAHWSVVASVGSSRPGPAVWAPMFSYYDRLYLVESVDQKHTLFSLRYKTLALEAEWFRLAEWEKSARVTSVLGNRTSDDFFIYFDDASVFSYANGTVSESVGPDAPSPVSELSPGYVAPAGTVDTCAVQMTNESILVGGQVIALFEQPSVGVRIYLEEWLTIDVFTKANIVTRVHNAIEWQIGEPTVDVLGLTTYVQQAAALDMVTRTYMHQARWSLHRDVFVRNRLSDKLDDRPVQYIGTTSVPSDELQDFFSTLDPSIFEDTPTTSPNRFSVEWEGDTFERSIVLYGVYDSSMLGYTQLVDFGRDEVVVESEWNATDFRLRLKRSNGPGFVEWRSSIPIRTFALVIHLEEWLYDSTEPFVPKYTVTNTSSVDALFQMFVMTDVQPTYNMLYQTNAFLAYTPSHCSMTASDQCPGMLPYVQLPCSGRGKCSISCQCTCEVAKSVLASSTSALGNVQWSDSPYRGSGCEITCPGYDGYDLGSVCNSRGTCQRDGKCTCAQGYTGSACQFECPVNERNETCSLHGGCGTRSIDETSFPFTGDDYLDTLSAKNFRHYQHSLRDFYDNCVEQNFIEQKGTFGSHVVVLSTENTLSEARKVCNTVNRELDSDFNLKVDRLYPVGHCVGVRANNEVMILNAPATTAGILQSVAFECDSDCNIETSDTDDGVIVGIESMLKGSEYTFGIQYQHGVSSGTKRYTINGLPVDMKFDWTPSRCWVEMNSQTIVDTTEPVQYISFVITQRQYKVVAYPTILPNAPSDDTIYVAPQYEKKYMQMTSHGPGYWFLALSQDTREFRPLMSMHDAERECDLFDDCEGIVRWPNAVGATLYSMFTSSSLLDGITLTTLNATETPFDYFQKSSRLYVGRVLDESKCARVQPGQSKYPTVKYTEEYNIPIQNANLNVVRDDVTGTVQVGAGVWTNCWTHMPNIHTKLECYQKSTEDASYGFAFSDVTGTCLVYTGITDPTKIKLNEYTDETRLTSNHPCTEASRWFA
jgi:hypothetical protein